MYRTRGTYCEVIIGHNYNYGKIKNKQTGVLQNPIRILLNFWVDDMYDFRYLWLNFYPNPYKSHH